MKKHEVIELLAASRYLLDIGIRRCEDTFAVMDADKLLIEVEELKNKLSHSRKRISSRKLRKLMTRVNTSVFDLYI